MNVTLVLSEKCNLNCSYCFEGIKSDPRVLAFNKAIERLIKLPDNTGIEFYGGEPLLQIPLIKQIMDWIKQNGRIFKFSMTTNGQIIPGDVFIDDYLSHFEHIRLSIDGPEEVHDRNRGKGSFKKAINFLKKLNSTGYNKIYLNPTFTRENLPYLFISAKCFFNLQKNYGMPRQGFSINIGDRLTWSDEDFIQYEEQLHLILDWYGTLSEIDKENFRLSCLENARKKESNFGHYFMACTAGIDHYSISPSGKIFPCVTEVFLDKPLRHPALAAIPDHNQYRQLTMKDDFDECFHCERYECGPCPALFKQLTGDYRIIPKNYCRFGKLTNTIINRYLKEKEMEQ
jgi:uncharacterized protein